MKKLFCLLLALAVLFTCSTAFAGVSTYYYKYDGEKYARDYDDSAKTYAVYKSDESGIIFKYKYSDEKFSSVRFVYGGVTYSLNYCGDNGELLFSAGSGSSVDYCEDPGTWTTMYNKLMNLVNSVGLSSVPTASTYVGTVYGSGVSASAGTVISGDTTSASQTALQLPQTGAPCAALLPLFAAAVCVLLRRRRAGNAQ